MSKEALLNYLPLESRCIHDLTNQNGIRDMGSKTPLSIRHQMALVLPQQSTWVHTPGAYIHLRERSDQAYGTG